MALRLEPSRWRRHKLGRASVHELEAKLLRRTCPVLCLQACATVITMCEQQENGCGAQMPMLKSWAGGGGACGEIKQGLPMVGRRKGRLH